MKQLKLPTSQPESPQSKEVTILISDLRGFTGLAETLAPEELHALLNEYFRVMIEGITRYEGFIDKFVGDEVMALFGAPIAHEDDPYRAADWDGDR